MRRVTTSTAVLVLALLLAVPAVPAGAQVPAQERPSGSGLQGQYYDNTDFAELVTARIDPQIAFDWEREVPDGVPLSGEGDDFAVIWTGFVQPAFTETYTFTTSSDDGVRLVVDGQTVIENFREHAQTEDSGSIGLEAGRLHELTLEYFDVGGEALIFLGWESASQPRQLVPTERLYPPDTPAAAPSPVASAAPPPPPPVGPPDLAITGTGVSGAAQAGSPILFTATIVNQGQGPTPADVPVSVQFSAPQGELAAIEHTGVIAPGEVVNLTSPAPGWTAVEGEFQITAQVDEVNRVAESDEDNNTVPQTLRIAPAPGAVPTATTSPAPDGTVRLVTMGLLALGVLLLLANLVVAYLQRDRSGRFADGPETGGTSVLPTWEEPDEADVLTTVGTRRSRRVAPGPSDRG